MQKSRGSDMPPPQRQAPRAPLHVKTAVCSESNAPQHRAACTPKLDGRRSPRSPLPERKRCTAGGVVGGGGGRAVELEAKLRKALAELDKLRAQLASTEGTKEEAQKALEVAKKHVGINAADAVSEGEISTVTKHEEEAATGGSTANSPVTTHVFEVEFSKDDGSCEDDVNKEDGEAEIEVVVLEPPDLSKLMEKMTAMEKEMSQLILQNAELNKKVEEVAGAASRVSTMEAELWESRSREGRLGMELRAAEARKEALEAEMKRLNVQTNQWRKAAEAATAMLSEKERGKLGTGCGRPSAERHRSPDGACDVGHGSSPLMREDGERKSAGILGELWKKRGHWGQQK